MRIKLCDCGDPLVQGRCARCDGLRRPFERGRIASARAAREAKAAARIGINPREVRATLARHYKAEREQQARYSTRAKRGRRGMGAVRSAP